MDRYTVLEPCHIPGRGWVGKGDELDLSRAAARYHVLRGRLRRIDPEPAREEQATGPKRRRQPAKQTGD